MAVLLLLLTAGAAEAQQSGRARIGFSAYVAGFNILDGEIGIEMQPLGYRLGLRFQTTGTFGAMITATGAARVDGQWREDDAVPRDFTSWGAWRGRERHIELAYPDGQPLVRVLIPEQDTDREPVAAEWRRDTIDSFSMFAVLMRKIARTGGCDGQIRTFDGRRAAVITSRTAGIELLPQESRSSFQGPALRCDVQSRQVSGFPRDAGPNDSARQPQTGTIWLAAVVPGMPPVPVLMSLDTRMVGHINVYVTRADSHLDIAAFTPQRPADLQ